MNSELIVKRFQDAGKTSARLDLDWRTMRPCIGTIVEDGLDEGGEPSRNTGAHLIASELRRLGKDEDFVLDALKAWNQKNRPPMRESEIQSTVRSAFRKEYKYSCKHSLLRLLCTGETFCPHAKLKSRSGKYTKNRLFLTYGWQNILSNTATALYYIAIPELEKLQGVGAGGVVIANHKKFATLAGITPKSVGKALRELSQTPLIKKFERGTPRKWEGKATLIQRTIPIPPPPDVPSSKREKPP